MKEGDLRSGDGSTVAVKVSFSDSLGEDEKRVRGPKPARSVVHKGLKGRQRKEFDLDPFM